MSGRKPKEIKKAQYYVWYLGWRECRGVWGREFTEPIARDLLLTRRGEELPKLTLEVSRKELKIVQLVEKKKGKTEKIKYPPIPAKDVTYAVQVLSPDEDVVACIYLGYNPQTRCAVHVHVYRCDSVETAAILTAHLNQLIELPEHQQRAQKIEKELVAKGQVVPRPTPYGRFPVDSEPGDTGSDVYGQRSPREEPDFATNTCESDEPGPSPEHLNLYDNLAAELRAKLGSRDNQPILLPPKDYDTVHRSKGKLINLDDKKATNEKVVGDIGAGGIFAKGFQNSSGDDSARGDSENGSLRNSQNGEQQPGGGYTAMYGGVGAGGVPWPRIHVEEDPVDRGSTGSDRNRDSYHSNGIPEDPYEVRPDDKYFPGRVRPPVSPRGPVRSGSPPRRAASPAARHAPSPGRGSEIYSGRERPARRDLSPGGMPRSPRGGSPLPRSRELSPVRYQPAIGPPTGGGGARPMSPPPELRDSYFPNKGLPGYLQASDVSDVYGAATNSSAVFDHRLPSRNSGGSSGGPKYTATSLGLTDRPAGGVAPQRSRDEGYRSLDRQDRSSGGAVTTQYFDNPYASGARHTENPLHNMPNLPGGGGGYPREGLYGAYQPRDVVRNVRGYDDRLAPEYARGSGEGFDYLP